MTPSQINVFFGEMATLLATTGTLKRPGVANFAEIIKIVIILIKTTFKDSIVKRIGKMYQNTISICISRYDHN